MNTKSLKGIEIKPSELTMASKLSVRGFNPAESHSAKEFLFSCRSHFLSCAYSSEGFHVVFYFTVLVDRTHIHFT